DLRIETAETGDVAAGARQAGDEAVSYRVGDDCEDDRDGCGGALERRDHGRAVGHDHVGLRCDQLRRMARDTVGIAAAPAVFEADISPIDPPHPLPPPGAARVAPLRSVVAPRGPVQRAPLLYGLALPRAPRQRPRRRTAEKRG